MKTIAAGLQWLMFHIGVVISVPVIVGGGFQLSPAGVENLIALTFIITGIGSLLQVALGHGNLLIEGPAGPWWAAFLVIVSVSTAGGIPIQTIRTDIQGALIIAGLVLFAAGLLGIIRLIKQLFTPRVTGVFLLLIAVQISGIAIERMVADGLGLFVISVGVLLLSITLLTKAKGLLKQAALLISILLGWGLAGVLGLTTETLTRGGTGLLQVPELFPWGTPSFDPGTVITLSILGFLLIPNQIGSLKAMESATGDPIATRRYDLGLAASGLTSFFAGLTGGVGTTPFAISAGLVSVTKDKRRLPFLLGAGLFILIGLLSPLARVLTTLPGSIAGAILLISISSIAMIGVSHIGQEKLSTGSTFSVGISILAGTGVMLMPSEFWPSLPPLVSSIFSNGVITGTLAALFFEQLVFPNAQ